MTIPTERAERERGEKTFEQKLAHLRATPEERARILASSPPFDYEAWVREVGPATAEELQEMEEFLREREEERLQSLASEDVMTIPSERTDPRHQTFGQKLVRLRIVPEER